MHKIFFRYQILIFFPLQKLNFSLKKSFLILVNSLFSLSVFLVRNSLASNSLIPCSSRGMMTRSPECPNLALKSFFRAQNTPKLEDFFLKVKKNFEGKKPLLGNFFLAPPNLKILPTSLLEANDTNHHHEYFIK